MKGFATEVEHTLQLPVSDLHIEVTVLAIDWFNQFLKLR